MLESCDAAMCSAIKLSLFYYCLWERKGTRDLDEALASDVSFCLILHVIYCDI